MLEVDLFQIPGGRRTDQFDRTTLIVGRSAKCDVVIRDPDVSRRHLKIDLVGGELWAEDLGSSNGSTLDGEPLAQRSRVAAGQVLRICDHEIRVRILDDRVSAGPPDDVATVPPGPSGAPSASAAPVTAAPPMTSVGPAASMAPPHPGSQAPAVTPTHGGPAAQMAPTHPPAASWAPPDEPAAPHPYAPPPNRAGPHPPYAPPPQQLTPLMVAPALGPVETPLQGTSHERTFHCSEQLWQSYEHMAHEAGVSVDELVNEALAFYGRRRVYAYAGSATHPQTSLTFATSPPSVLELITLPKS